MTDLTFALLIADNMERSAEWRQRKAGEYPDDKQRNLDCAKAFLDMAARLRAFKGGPWYDRYCRCFDDDDNNLRLTEEEQITMGNINFAAQEPDEFFESIVENSGVDAH